MTIRENCSLKDHNTFGMDVKSDRMVDWSTPDELKGILADLERPVLMMGGGSNLLFMSDFKGTVLHSSVTTIDILGITNDHVHVRVGSGVVWDDFVAWCAVNGYWGVENLSAIPGEVGASAVQNIGAYGVEAKDVIDTVQTICLADGSERDFINAECRYGYRQSIFKNELKGQYAVAYVIFTLSRKPEPRLGYGALEQEVERLGGPSLENIRQAVISIRDSKLPDPDVLGNAGSFFMNPVITEQDFNIIRSSYPDVPSYPAAGGLIKVPAGWLIEKTGWKGRSLGPAAVYEKQALVLVNKGGATGADIKRLADTIIEDVRQKFGITLSTEVNYI
ncbi:MAG: UDP-N-acetylmuramate dehydrogenase [Bacteroidaceae bacterium]|nr:UDP-N-acetylmuramate dehydrogenase [Bacteroidaceae bacterium]